MTRTNSEIRQKHRTNGKYAKYKNCDGGCGAKVNPENYCSHAMTDCVDAEGVEFGDTGLVLCNVCAMATSDMQTKREFLAFVHSHASH